LNLTYDQALSKITFNYNLRRYSKGNLGARRPSQVQAHLMQQRLAAEQRWMLGSTTSMAGPNRFCSQRHPTRFRPQDALTLKQNLLATSSNALRHL
jgi:hypothetical protein